MDEENIGALFIEAAESGGDVTDWVNALNEGYGTYNEVDNIAEYVGDEIAKRLQAVYSDERLRKFVEEGHQVITEAGVQAQSNLNDAAKIGIKPKVMKCPEAKIDDLIFELADLDSDALNAILKVEIPSLMMSMVDDMVEYNADFQADAGLSPYIVRTWSGMYPSHDTKHTDWCHDLAGTYNYRDRPDNVFARHRGCRCKVEYFPSKGAKGQIAALAKGEVDREGVLWNTNPETLQKRIARMERREARERNK